MAVVATLSKGYDLDYIWKQVDRGPAKDAASYYIQASESGGEPPRRWWGPGARTLGLEPGQRVECKPYDLLFGERKAPDGTRLGRPPGAGRKAADLYAALLAAEPHATAERRRELRTEAVKQARQSPLFFDLTISISKSISIFHASLGENARLARQAGDHEGDQYWSALVTEIDDMIWQAVQSGFGYFQREAGYTRTGSHNTRVHGRETGQWHEADLAVAHWLQHTSRDGDMQLHVHSQIAHVAKTATDGKWRAPDSLGYNEHIGAVAAIVSQHLEEALTRRFGLEWTARDDGHGFEIKDISDQMMRVFSSRRESITADLRTRAARFEQRYGRKPSQRELAQLAQTSNFKTRAAKKEGALDFTQLHAGWADKLARTAGVSLASVAPSVWHNGTGRADARPRGADGPALTELELSRAAQKAVALAQLDKSAWTRADVIKYLGRVLPRADHTVEAGEPGRTLANGDLLRIDAVTRDGLIVRRALGADPRTGQRRWTGRAFRYAGYRDAELGYAVTDHAAQGRTVHTGLAVITGTEDRQHAYVAALGHPDPQPGPGRRRSPGRPARDLDRRDRPGPRAALPGPARGRPAARPPRRARPPGPVAVAHPARRRTRRPGPRLRPGRGHRRTGPGRSPRHPQRHRRPPPPPSWLPRAAAIQAVVRPGPRRRRPGTPRVRHRDRRADGRPQGTDRRARRRARPALGSQRPRTGARASAGPAGLAAPRQFDRRVPGTVRLRSAHRAHRTRTHRGRPGQASGLV